jgi:hypothetical protein
MLKIITFWGAALVEIHILPLCVDGCERLP